MSLEQAHAAIRAGMEIADSLRGNLLACAGLGGKAPPTPAEVEGLWYLVDTADGHAVSRDWCEAQRQTLKLKGKVASISLGQEDLAIHAQTVAPDGDGLVYQGADGRLTLTWATPQRRLHLATADGDAAVAVRPEQLDGETRAFVETLAGQRWQHHSEPERRFLTAREHECLTVQFGSLTQDERRAIEAHVVHTRRFLEQIP
jgi:hypothetical protein